MRSTTAHLEPCPFLTLCCEQAIFPLGCTFMLQHFRTEASLSVMVSVEPGEHPSSYIMGMFVVPNNASATRLPHPYPSMVYEYPLRNQVTTKFGGNRLQKRATRARTASRQTTPPSSTVQWQVIRGVKEARIQGNEIASRRMSPEEPNWSAHHTFAAGQGGEPHWRRRI